ncbi:MAG: sigma-70 family RNA polymerase sigma factor [Deltaproteobacteria bacterium]|nr:sigma-70 family RNA polymerase sigma factor [Deltaproteobacteria bacterium]MDH3384085.1 sigma-70 family RNA polymerase sigma factor [Deltaproteobacteria bacterium]
MDPGVQDFRTIYASYHPRIFRYLTRLVGQSEAEDLTQEVFLRVNRGLPDFKGDAKLSTWIYRIATNVATDRMRSRSFQESRSGKATPHDEQLIEESVDLTGEKKPSVEKQAMREEMSSCVHDYINSLPENYRAAVTLSEIGGLTNKEIAEMLGLTVETVKIRLHRGRAKLKEKLEAGCSFDRDEEDILVCDPKTDPDHPE